MKTHIRSDAHDMSLGQLAFVSLLRWFLLTALAMIPLHHAGAVAPAPTVASPTSASLTYTGATLGGNVTAQGDSSITGRGVVYSRTATNPDPQIGGTGVSQRAAAVGAGTGVFTVAISALTPGTSYSFCAYATNSAGTAYSIPATFTTPADPPAIGAATVATITINSATLGGNVTTDNSSAITQRGVVYSVTVGNGDPTLTNGASVAVAATSSTGVFTVPVSGLLSTTQYSFKAYATNSAGTTYTAVSTFTTLPYAPTVSSPTSASVTISTATLGGSVTSSNSAAITQRGVVYSLSTSNGDPSLTNGASVAVAATATTGTFTVPVTGLQPSRLYYYRAYATNSVGTSYSWTNTFVTLPYAPSVGSPTCISFTINSATLRGSVSSDNSAAITARGIVYSVTSVNGSPSLTNGASIAAASTLGTGSFTVLVSGLLPSTNYSFRVYATNSIGTSYSWTNSFTTYPYAPTIGSPTSSLITGRTALLGGNVSADNSANITERGVVYSSTDNDPRINDFGVAKDIATGTTIGQFTKSVTGLVPKTMYYFKAYATNSVGTSYTSVGTFTTPDVPTVIEPTDTSITTTGVILGGNVTSENLAAITERGIVYSVSASNSNPLVGVLGVTKEIVAGTTGIFVKELTGLAIGTTYSYKAYATNSEGTAYSDVLTFRTTSVAPTIDGYPTSTAVTTDPSTALGSASLGGTITKAGAEFIERGVVYALDTVALNPAIDDGKSLQKISSDTAGTTGAFSVDVTDLLPGRQYYFFAYVKNDKATVYNTRRGNFKTPAVEPVVIDVTEGEPSSTGITLGGNVTTAGGSTLTEVGIVYSVTSVNANPLLSGTGVSKATGATATGIFTKAITGLKPFTTYSYQVYATNTVGTGYSGVGTFTTAAGAPTITSPSKASVLVTKAILGGNVTKSNGDDVTERGVVYSITAENKNPEIGGDNVTKERAATAGTGVFTVTITGLAPNTAYSFKAYAKNSKGTTYTRVSDTIAASTFTTPVGNPTVESPTESAVEAFTATLGGDVTSASGAAITERGVVYSISSTKPSLGNAKAATKSGTTTGVFTLGVTGLQPAKKYYYRAYAKNSKGVGYSTVGTFTTKAAAPSIHAVPLAPSDFIKATSVKLGGRGIKANGSPITERGVVYSSTDSDPKVGVTGVTKKTTTATFSSFGITVSGLTAGKKYFFKAYAKNALGTTYTDVDSFTTDQAAATVLAGAPVGSALAGASAADTTQTYYTVGADGLKYLTIVISNTAQAPTVEVSGNLTDWFSGNSHTTVLSDAGGILKVRDNTPVTAGAKRYIRMKP